MEAIADIDNLRLAYWKSRKGKEDRVEVIEFRTALQYNLAKISEELRGDHVCVGNYAYFKIFDPKERLICAAAFRERVIHHAVMNVCHHDFDKRQIFDSYACRIGKGTFKSLDRAYEFAGRYRWFVKMDVRKYFDNIRHIALKQQLAKMFKDDGLLRLLNKIIDSYSVGEDRGLPIGNLTSQYFANHYLSVADHHAKEKLCIDGYVRYMDDIVLFGDDKEELLAKARLLELYLKDVLDLELGQFYMNRCRCGIPYLGYRVLGDIVLLSKRSKTRYKKKINEVFYKYRIGEYDQEMLQNRLLPLTAYTEKADSKSFRKKIILKGGFN